MWTRHRPILYILVISMAVHACAVAAVYRSTGRIDTFAFNSLDSREYYQIARNLSEHFSFSQSPEPPLTPDTWRTPGYPAFLAAIMVICGDSPSVLIVIQQLLSVGNMLLLFGLARQPLGDRRAAILAVLFLLEPYHLYYSLWLMATTLFVTVILLTWHVWQEVVEHGRWSSCGWLGILCGLAVLIRPVAILLPLVVTAGVILVVFPRRPKVSAQHLTRPGWPKLLVFVVGVVVIVASWMWRNHHVAGHFALSDQSGVVLAYFKATEVVLWREGRTSDRYLETSLDPARASDSHSVWDRIDSRLQQRLSEQGVGQSAALHWRNLAQGNKTTIDSFEISKALSRIGWSELVASPLSTAACYLTRCGSILTFPLNLILHPPRGSEANRARSGILAAPYVILCLVIIASLIGNRATFTLAYFPLACTVGLLLATTPQIDPRFRVPMIPMLLFLALLPPGRRSLPVSPTDEGQ